MLLLDFSDLGERGSDVFEALFLGHSGEFGVKRAPLFLLSVGCSQQVLLGGSDLAGGVGRGDLDWAAFEVLEEHLRVFFLVVCGLREDRCDLLITLFLGYACEEGVAVAGLALAGEGLE